MTWEDEQKLSMPLEEWLTDAKQVSYPYDSVIQLWVRNLPLKLQTTLMSSVRGPDGVPRNDVMKTLVRGIRKMCMLPAREKHLRPDGFMFFELEDLGPAIAGICNDLPKYPTHYVQHAIEAAETIAYGHPLDKVRKEFFNAYLSMAKEFHLNPETREQWWARGNKK